VIMSVLSTSYVLWSVVKPSFRSPGLPTDIKQSTSKYEMVYKK